MWVPRHKHKEKNKKDNTAGGAKRNVSGFLVESVPSRRVGTGLVRWSGVAEPGAKREAIQTRRRFSYRRRKIRESRMHELSWNKQHINRYNQSYQSELDSSLLIPYGFDVVGSTAKMDGQRSVSFHESNISANGLI